LGHRKLAYFQQFYPIEPPNVSGLPEIGNFSYS
jgi:hypothetical protein